MRGGAPAILGCVSVLMSLVIDDRVRRGARRGERSDAGKEGAEDQSRRRDRRQRDDRPGVGTRTGETDSLRAVGRAFQQRAKRASTTCSRIRAWSTRPESNLTMAAPAPLQVQSYEGPSCPRCHARLTADWIQSGTVICPDCNKPFEATAFRPPRAPAGSRQRRRRADARGRECVRQSRAQRRGHQLRPLRTLHLRAVQHGRRHRAALPVVFRPAARRRRAVAGGDAVSRLRHRWRAWP